MDKMNENKERKAIWFVPIFIIFLSLVGFAQAVDTYNYFEEPVVPEAENLEIKNNLLVDYFSGAAVYRYPLTVPPGINGLQPALSLTYNSQSMGQRTDSLGSAWSISESYIQRDTNHSFANTSDDGFILVIEGASYDLRNSSDGKYHTKIETFYFINKTLGADNEKGEYWIVKTKEGTQYRFGFYNFSETISNKYDYAWRWNLDLVNDTYGNSIFYNYTENPTAQDRGVAYLDRINYNNDKQRSVNFYYEYNGLLQMRTSYENGNLVTKSKMLKEIVMNVSDQTVRRYALAYKKLGADQGNVSAISNITEYGNDSTNSLPPVMFGYEKGGSSYDFANWSHQGCRPGNTSGCFVDNDDEDLGARFLELNGDGLVDLVVARDDGSPDTLAWLNNGTGWEPTNWTQDPCNPLYGAGCFVGNNGDDIGTRLVDLNGDGLTDVFRAYSNGMGYYGIWVYFNNGTTWNKSDSWSFSDCQNGISTYGCFITEGHDYGVRFVDLTGDGLVDLFRAHYYNDVIQVKAWKNNGNGFYETNWTHQGCRSDNASGCFVGNVDNDWLDIGTRLVDFNGDGLTDIIRADGGTTFAWINNGTGWEPTNWTHEGCSSAYGSTGGCFTSDGSDIGTRLVDINGDGLVDVFRAYNGGQVGTWTYVNNGTGWVHQDGIYSGCANGGNTLGCFANINGNDQGVRVLDLNGDGLADIFKGKAGSPDPIIGAWNNSGFATYLLKNITFSIGGTLSIKYQKSTSLDNTGNDDRGDLEFNVFMVSNITKNNSITGSQNIISITNYNFSGGFYNYSTREFRGFNFAEEKIANKVTKHWFHQDQARSGKEYKTEILDNQTNPNPYKTIEREWDSTLQNGYYIVELGQDSEIDYDSVLANPKIKNTTYSYDGFGNIVYKHSLGDIANSDDDKFQFYKYVNNTDAWIVNKLINYSLVNFDNATLLRNTLYSYDNLSFGASPTRGSITRKEEWLNGGNNAVMLYGYNSFGNLVNSTDAEGRLTKSAYGTRDTTNTFPDNMTNAKNHVTNYFYDLGTGNLLAEMDSNEFIKNYTYDSLSIEKTAILPLDTINFPTQNYSYNFTTGNVGKIIVRQREQSGEVGTLDSYKFYDGLGRLIQTKTEAPNSQQVVVDTYYDEIGRIKEQSNPYFALFSENYSVPNTTVAKTTFNYDALDRVIKVTNPDNTFKNISYNRWNVTLYDENGNIKNYTLNSYGKIIWVIESNSGEAYYTKYDYNGADELTGIADAMSNTINYTYDTLGRKIRMIDPDMGTWNYQYDAAGNLIKQTDNLGENITITYDDINRKVNESTGVRSVIYVYDLLTNNTLSRVFASDFAINYTYDSRLRKISEEKTVDSIATIENWTYDSSDRVLSQKLPSGEVINFTYNEQGLLSSVKNMVNAVYNEKNDPVGIFYNNTLSTNYTYFINNFRLKQIKTANKQDLNYTYDSVGNVKEINDTIHSRNITMNYDALNRLIYTQIADTQTTTSNFIYNSIGNMLNMTGTQNAEFYYNSGKVHAPSKVVFY